MSTGTEHSFAIGLICNWCHLQVVGDLQKIDFALEFKLSKTLSGLVYFVLYLHGGRSPPITAIQNTQAHSEFLTTSIPKQKPRLHKKLLDSLGHTHTLNNFSLKLRFLTLRSGSGEEW